jgi:hypothetical protein
MARFLRRIALANEDVPASTTRQPFDLPVNPLSHLLVRFQITKTNPAAIGTYSAIDDVITQITDVTIRHNGENIIQGSLRDLMILNMAAFKAMPGWGTLEKTSAGIHSVVFPIVLGRRMYDPKSCFPATQRGNLQMLFTAGADGAGTSDINISVESYELIEAEPEEYVKYTSRSMTSVVGQFDARLPIGNPIMGALLFDTGLFSGTAESLAWGQVKLLKDNVEQYYAECDFEVIAGELQNHIGSMPFWPGHIHQMNGAAAGLADSDDAEVPASQGLRGYGYLNFDPTEDKQYILETAGASDLLLRGNGDQAAAVRWLPIELVPIKK